MNDTNIKDQALTIYSKLIDDIQFAKLQQWRTVYYCVILLGAILTSTKTFCSPSSKFINLILSIVSGAIGILGCIAIIIFQRSLNEYRKKVNKLKYEFFSNKFIDLKILQISKERSKLYYFLSGCVILFAFYATILFATIFVVLTICGVWW